MTPMPPSDTPTPKTLPPSDAADALLDKAERAGQLKPVEDALKAEGRLEDISARDFMRYAQFDERTKGKTPPELAQMIADDSSIVDDIAAEQEKREGAEEPPGKESPMDMMTDRMNKARAESPAE